MITKCTRYSKGGHNSVPLDTVAMGLPSSEAVEVPGNRLPAHGVYGSITQILPVPAKSYSFLVCNDIIYHAHILWEVWLLIHGRIILVLHFFVYLLVLLCCNAMILHVLLLLFLCLST